MNEARELLALRITIHAALDPQDIPRVNFQAITKAATEGIHRGWTGDELARAAVEGIYTGDVDDIGALMMTNLRAVAGLAPPREVTATPPPISAVLARLHGRNQPTSDPAAWAARIRGGGAA
jgi:hypothetical protein